MKNLRDPLPDQLQEILTVQVADQWVERRQGGLLQTMVSLRERMLRGQKVRYLHLLRRLDSLITLLTPGKLELSTTKLVRSLLKKLINTKMDKKMKILTLKTFQIVKQKGT